MLFVNNLEQIWLNISYYPYFRCELRQIYLIKYFHHIENKLFIKITLNLGHLVKFNASQEMPTAIIQFDIR